MVYLSCYENITFNVLWALNKKEKMTNQLQNSTLIISEKLAANIFKNVIGHIQI
jgi:hypothetical protein